MSVAFQCPSCLRGLHYENGDTPFQTCYHCKGKIIVPSTVVHQVEIEEERPTEYALREQRDLKLAEIQNELNAGRKISAIKVFRETFGTDLQTAKESIERMEANKQVKLDNAELRENYSAMQEGISPTTSAQTNLAKTGQQSKIGQLIMTLIYIAIGVAVFFWLMD